MLQRNTPPLPCASAQFKGVGGNFRASHARENAFRGGDGVLITDVEYPQIIGVGFPRSADRLAVPGPGCYNGTMNDLSPETVSVEEMLQELKAHRPSHAPTMGKLKKVRYSHEALIDMIIQAPWLTQGQIAAAFGYSASWLSNILASDAFQAKMAARREEIVDPMIKASIEERFRALTIRSLEVLQEKLSKPAVSDQVALRAAELGAKALGVGGHAPPRPADDGGQRLEQLANRLLSLQSNVRERVISEQDGVEVTVVREAE